MKIAALRHRSADRGREIEVVECQVRDVFLRLGWLGARGSRLLGSRGALSHQPRGIAFARSNGNWTARRVREAQHGEQKTARSAVWKNRKAVQAPQRPARPGGAIGSTAAPATDRRGFKGRPNPPGETQLASHP